MVDRLDAYWTVYQLALRTPDTQNLRSMVQGAFGRLPKDRVPIYVQYHSADSTDACLLSVAHTAGRSNDLWGTFFELMVEECECWEDADHLALLRGVGVEPRPTREQLLARAPHKTPRHVRDDLAAEWVRLVLATKRTLPFAERMPAAVWAGLLATGLVHYPGLHRFDKLRDHGRRVDVLYEELAIDFQISSCVAVAAFALPHLFH